MSLDPRDSRPPIPPGIIRNYFGSRVMQWGTGYGAAVARKDTITRDWLVEHGVTHGMTRAWRRFYEETYQANPENLSAKGRIELLEYCERLFEGQGTDAVADEKG
jgi:hypothetical protein